MRRSLVALGKWQGSRRDGHCVIRLVGKWHALIRTSSKMELGLAISYQVPCLLDTWEVLATYYY